MSFLPPFLRKRKSCLFFCFVLFTSCFFFMFVKGGVFFDRVHEFLHEKEILKSPIPKKIHYVWVGGPVPEEIQKNINDWHQKMPDYEIKKWDESNCNVNDNAFVKEAYAKKEWRFVSDWCRLEALSKEGGIYLDTDTKINKSFYPLLGYHLVLTREKKDNISAGVIAVTKNHPFIQKLMASYRAMPHWEYKTSPEIWTRIFYQMKEGLSSYHIYGAQILMLNLNSDENYAEHLYANGSIELQKCSSWYDYYQRFFVYEEAITLVTNQNETKEMILSEKNLYYGIQKKEGGCYEKTNEMGRYEKTEPQLDFYMLTLHPQSGGKKVFGCVAHRCQEY